MPERSIEDRLRAEYFDLLPEIRRVANQLEAEIRYHTLPVARRLNAHEQLVVASRIKECSSAIDKLRKKEESRSFDPDKDRESPYSLLKLRDLAGVRVLAFPRNRLAEIDGELRERFPGWESDPIKDAETGETLAFKYHGYRTESSERIQGEYQIVSTLTGLFWDVEHAAIYKINPKLRSIAESPLMKERTRTVNLALREFEQEFERLIRQEGETSEG